MPCASIHCPWPCKRRSYDLRHKTLLGGHLLCQNNSHVSRLQSVMKRNGKHGSGHQDKPIAWQALSLGAPVDSVPSYTARVMYARQARVATPEIVRVGNEITSGRLWDDGLVGGSFGTPAQRNTLAQLWTAPPKASGRQAVNDQLSCSISIVAAVRSVHNGSLITSARRISRSICWVSPTIRGGIGHSPILDLPWSNSVVGIHNQFSLRRRPIRGRSDDLITIPIL